MVTQSLRGMTNHGPMHWRGDRNGSLDEPTSQPDGGQFDEALGFKKFNPAFQTLVGRADTLTDSESEMQSLTDFILQVVYPPNPIRNLDNSLTPDQAAGFAQFFQPNTQFTQSCNDCHRLDLNGNRQFGVARPGFFGTMGEINFLTFDPKLPQPLKIPHLRNMYQKVGRFGTGSMDVAGVPLFENRGYPNMGDQMRGFGFLHDGGIDTLFRFLTAFPFSTAASANGFPLGTGGDAMRRQMEEYMMVFDSNMAPIVGQQITPTAGVVASVSPRINLMMARATAGECDLVVKTRLDEGEAGFLFNNAGAFVPDRHGAPSVSFQGLIDMAQDQGLAITFTCAPPGSGVRMALDRNGDGIYDGDSLANHR
ncbi:conserved hypothetical protein [Candidatus Sulfopaludibacter sp. SbA3]|nr:conserved hypothetical protein [Candidatus Sulfopaludibacter sp. SbA3]